MFRTIITTFGAAVLAGISGLLLVRNDAADMLLGAVLGAMVFCLALLAQAVLHQMAERKHLEARLSLLIDHARLDEAGMLPDRAMLDDLAEIVAAWRQAGNPESTPAPRSVEEAAYPAAASRSLLTPDSAESAAPVHSRQSMTWVLRNALSENKVDLFLQPIVELPARKPRHYECLSRIRDDAQNIHEPSAFLELAEDKGMAGSLDNMLLFRVVQLVRGAGNRHRRKRFFCNLSPQSLEDAGFLAQFEDYLQANQGLASRLVFELTWQDVQTIRTEAAAMLERLARAGFRLSIDGADPAMVGDEAACDHYRTLGLAYLKMPAEQLLSAGADVRAALSPRRLRDLTIIATHVERETQIAELLELEVRLAQGYRFGEPRPARLPQQSFFAGRA